MYVFIVSGINQASGKLMFPGYMLDYFLIYHAIDVETQKLFKFRESWKKFAVTNKQSHNSYMNYYISYMKFLCRSTLWWEYIYLKW